MIRGPLPLSDKTTVSQLSHETGWEGVRNLSTNRSRPRAQAQRVLQCNSKFKNKHGVGWGSYTGNQLRLRYCAFCASRARLTRDLLCNLVALDPHDLPMASSSQQDRAPPTLPITSFYPTKDATASKG